MPGPKTAQAKLPAKHNPYVVERAGSATFTPAAEAANAINVLVQLNDANGTACAERISGIGYLSNDANGDVIATSAPTTATAGGANGMLHPLTTKSFMWTTEADGKLNIILTDSGTPTFYIILILPDGSRTASSAITFA